MPAFTSGSSTWPWGGAAARRDSSGGRRARACTSRRGYALGTAAVVLSGTIRDSVSGAASEWCEIARRNRAHRMTDDRGRFSIYGASGRRTRPRSNAVPRLAECVASRAVRVRGPERPSGLARAQRATTRWRLVCGSRARRGARYRRRTGALRGDTSATRNFRSSPSG